jgi:hypothetical protein
MAETKTIMFNHKEIAKILIQKQAIHEGIWGVIFEFALAGGLIPFPPGSDIVVPGAIVPIMKIGLQRFDAHNPITVDAAEVNPT